MCKPGEKLLFCTCVGKAAPIIHHKNGRKQKRLRAENSNQEVVWTLQRYLGKSDFSMEGIITFPSDKLPSGLELADVYVALNEGQCFDFEYSPQEGDQIHISQKDGSFDRAYISMIYRQGEWQAGFYGFEDLTQKLHEGKLNCISEDD